MMKALLIFRCITYLALCMLYTHTAKAQESNRPSYKQYFTGCWQTDSISEGYLTTRSDNTFQWIKPNAKNAAIVDSMNGTWDIQSQYSIPFKVDVIVLHFSNGKRKKYQIGTTSMPATIYLKEDHTFHKVACK